MRGAQAEAGGASGGGDLHGFPGPRAQGLGERGRGGRGGPSPSPIDRPMSISWPRSNPSQLSSPGILWSRSDRHLLTSIDWELPATLNTCEPPCIHPAHQAHPPIPALPRPPGVNSSTRQPARPYSPDLLARTRGRHYLQVRQNEHPPAPPPRPSCDPSAEAPGATAHSASDPCQPSRPQARRFALRCPRRQPQEAQARAYNRAPQPAGDAAHW